LPVLLLILLLSLRGLAQERGIRDSLSPAARPETPPAELRQMLTQATATAAAEQWDETIDLLQQVQARGSGLVLRLDPELFVAVSQICQQQLAALSPAGLSRYRQRYDEQAAEALERARDSRDLRQLARVVEQWFATSSGDDALWLLGEWQLESGQPGRARETWRQLHRKAHGPDETPAMAVRSADGKLPTRLIFPDTKIPLAEIRARLVLCTIAEQRWSAAERELTKYAEDFPATVGQLGGAQSILERVIERRSGTGSYAGQHREPPA
jgi:hypothetical protein